MPRYCIRPARSARRSTCRRSRRPRRIPTSSASSAISICRRRTARRSSATGEQRPGMVGFRFTFNQPHQKSWWTDGSLDWFWAACEREKLPVGLLAGGNMAAFRAIAERHPGLKLHIDHYGRAGGGGGATDAAAFADLPEMLALAEAPECRGQDFRRAELLGRALSVPRRAGIHEADHRRVRPAALLLGHRHHPDAVQLPAMRDDVHRGSRRGCRGATSNSSWGARSASGSAGTRPAWRKPA